MHEGREISKHLHPGDLCKGFSLVFLYHICISLAVVVFMLLPSVASS